MKLLVRIFQSPNSGGLMRTLRGFTEHTADQEPKWRHKGKRLTTGYDPPWRHK